MTQQMELFSARFVPAERVRAWRASLVQWVRDVWRYRHNRITTGWSMAACGFGTALLLRNAGFLSLREFRRYCKFNRRVMRWDRMPERGSL